MAKTRLGQELWQEWYGNDIQTELLDPVIFFTVEWVDLENDVVRRALGYSLQRHGILDSMREAMDLLETALVYEGYIFQYEGDPAPTFVSAETFDSSDTKEIQGARPATLVEFEIGD